MRLAKRLSERSERILGARRNDVMRNKRPQDIPRSFSV